MLIRFASGLITFFLATLTANGAPIVISDWLTNVNGDDSPYEYASS